MIEFDDKNMRAEVLYVGSSLYNLCYTLYSGALQYIKN